MKTCRIGSVTLEAPVILAPMAGVTDLPFRLLCREQGAALVSMEMVSAKAIAYHNKHTQELMATDCREHPVSLQLFGSDPDIVSSVARAIEEQPFDILDLNMGCPVPKVVKNGEGSALLKDPVLAGEIVARTAGAIHKPVTVKMRIGFAGADVDLTDFAKRMEESGAAAITVHGRTREQYYAGEADWEAIAAVKEAVSIPVIGNGDVNSPERAREMLDKTGCDAVMIGRAARGNPWIFHRVRAYLETGELLPAPSMEERRQMLLRHTRMTIACKGSEVGIRQMRKQIAWYTAGIPHAARLRGRLHEVETYAQLEEILTDLDI